MTMGNNFLKNLVLIKPTWPTPFIRFPTYQAFKKTAVTSEQFRHRIHITVEWFRGTTRG
jgi:hypothetical protein